MIIQNPAKFENTLEKAWVEHHHHRHRHHQKLLPSKTSKE
jgi:hypothetical protein